MAHIVIRKEEELQTLKRFLQNQCVKFNPNLVDYSYSEPCDVAYDKTQYQITAGDQDQLAKRRQDLQKHGQFCIIRSIAESNNPKIIIEKALQKKILKSNKAVNLLIDCISSADYYPGHIREIEFKKYISEHKELCGSWNKIFLVFRNQNIQLVE